MTTDTTMTSPNGTQLARQIENNPALRQIRAQIRGILATTPDPDGGWTLCLAVHQQLGSAIIADPEAIKALMSLALLNLCERASDEASTD